MSTKRSSITGLTAILKSKACDDQRETAWQKKGDKMFSFKNKDLSGKVLAFLYLAVFLTIFVMSCLTPLLTDDYTYSFNLVTHERIGSLGDLIQSLSYLRNEINGRVIAHAFAHLVLLMPKIVFNLLNGLNCVLLLYLGSRFLEKRNKPALVVAMLSQVLLIWNFMPAFGQVFLWLDGTMNYSWGLSIMCLFLWPFAAEYLGKAVKPGPVKMLMMCLVAFMAGAYSENGSVASIFMAVSFVLLLVIEKRKVPVHLLLMLAVAAVGFVFLTTAPAMSANQATRWGLSELASGIKTIVSETKDRLLPVYLLYALLFAINLKKENKRILIGSLILLVGGLVSLATFSFASYFITRHFCFTVYFTVIACGMLIVPCFEGGCKTLCRCLVAVLLVLFCFNAVVAGVDILGTYVNYRERLQVINEAKANGVTGLVLPPLLSSSEYSAAMRYDLASSADVWPNEDFARYYGLDWVKGDLPE